MEKRIALLKDGIVFNIVVGNSTEEMKTLFDCDTLEVTVESKQAYIGYGIIDGVFEQPPVIEEIYIPPVEETYETNEETPETEQV